MDFVFLLTVHNLSAIFKSQMILYIDVMTFAFFILNRMIDKVYVRGSFGKYVVWPFLLVINKQAH